MDWIYWLQLIHTAVFFFASGCVLYVVYCGLAGRTNTFLWTSMAVASLVGAANFLNGFECPLTTLIYHLAGRRDIADIFLPDWFAQLIMPVSAVVFSFGVVLVARNHYRARAMADAPESEHLPKS
ncbi:MAG: hypothetical protein JSV45_07030 [Chromatiales bacterium]|nr:MAG: hypothetical protein JSV45_07030 [Chromatiales bacterium]